MIERKLSRLCGPVLAQGALGDGTTGGGENHMQAAEGLDRRIQGFLGLGEVGDVDGEERTTQARGDRFTVGSLPVEDRHLGAVGGQQFRTRPAEAGGSAHHDYLLARDLHPNLLSTDLTGTLPPNFAVPPSGRRPSPTGHRLPPVAAVGFPHG